MSDFNDKPKNVCTLNKDGTASVFVKQDEQAYATGFVSDTLVKQPGIAQDVFAVMRMLMNQPSSNLTPLKPQQGVTGEYSSTQAQVYIPAQDKLSPAPDTQIDVSVLGWNGDQAKGLCALRVGDKAIDAIPIVNDTRPNPQNRDLLQLKP